MRQLKSKIVFLPLRVLRALLFSALKWFSANQKGSLRIRYGH